MRVRVRKIGKASHPGEIVVQIKTFEGTENLVVDRRAVDAKETLSIGTPVRRQGRLWQIELPHRTTRGSRRVWVKPSALVVEWQSHLGADLTVARSSPRPSGMA